MVYCFEVNFRVCGDVHDQTSLLEEGLEMGGVDDPSSL
jgi:hypothetical protein